MMPLPRSSLPLELLETAFEDELANDGDGELSFTSEVEGFDSSDEDSDEDSCSIVNSMSSADFFLDIAFLERDIQGLHEEFQLRRRERRSSLHEEDPLETDSLKLIRRRVPLQQRPEVEVVVPQEQQQLSLPETITNSPSPVMKKCDTQLLSLSCNVCEVPLGVSLKDIIPSSFFLRREGSNFQPVFPLTVGSSNMRTSEDLISGIDKALEIACLAVNE